MFARVWDGKLPFITEQDIIIVDLARDDSVCGENPLNNREQLTANRQGFINLKGQNYFNPTYLWSMWYRSEFNDILKNNGVIIVFSVAPMNETYYPVDFNGQYYSHRNQFEVSNYDWLELDLTVPELVVQGKEIIPNKDSYTLAETILKGSEGEVTL